jgi:hypothetical protein
MRWDVHAKDSGCRGQGKRAACRSQAEKSLGFLLFDFDGKMDCDSDDAVERKT